ncbi:hypothetical protein FE257_005780 [Aspergillus nanangensis]|uniref:Uncharacterized protein n=1 Tax=Aspergillus nanangensis TaxID=2582783 RepID=A0AAD4CQ73_ASPNN|nr:hypothetical protein FE257_005780 [Aspergillus nanangensis]
MQFSLPLAALALCITSAIAVPDPIAHVTLESSATGTVVNQKVLDGQCATYKYPSDPVSAISIAVFECVDVTCTFFSETGCEGSSYSLTTGLHRFSRDFYVGSFQCTV